jgi:hypothetical protein
VHEGINPHFLFTLHGVPETLITPRRPPLTAVSVRENRALYISSLEKLQTIRRYVVMDPRKMLAPFALMATKDYINAERAQLLIAPIHKILVCHLMSVGSNSSSVLGEPNVLAEIDVVDSGLGTDTSSIAVPRSPCHLVI